MGQEQREKGKARETQASAQKSVAVSFAMFNKGKQCSNFLAGAKGPGEMAKERGIGPS